MHLLVKLQVVLTLYHDYLQLGVGTYTYNKLYTMYIVESMYQHFTRVNN